ncbi:NupC/NupG family nucleoside CNT transporter [Propionibacterium australiense]|uniref:Nucleoside transporter n=1 Tax=Propionibacterium australiense TaxID=119981 RepID=A0A383S8B6_9ACTN|nr:nucleoside transporter C-terminal domain-containing protein [Propionibacterium australiense]RLP07700.1 nucleoside transporter [Propionibacterium australiense]RLP08127.1 nucleoside transporter [Propionibacterium australiense]SYZ33664.1 Na+ dependent nucleoside transporter C-terminus [Propionibacterium australiense]VEH92985.1 Purine nucleoside transport protein nupG [Propionibacterium australiense]
MYLALNVVGIIVFLAIGLVFSHDRKKIDWKSVGILAALNVALAWILTSFPWGRAAVQGAAAAFNELVDVAWAGINFALANWVGADGVNPEPVNFVVSALLPILLILPIFDILTYIGFLPWLIKWIGRILSFITRRPKFETFYSIEMMFLGNTEAPVVSKLQLQKMSPARNVVVAMMTMSCVTASILAAYIQMMPAEYILTAVPLNCLNALIVTSMLYPVDVTAEEDVIYTYEDGLAEDAEKQLVPAGVAAEQAPEAQPAETSPAAGAAAKPGTGGWPAKIFKRDPNRPKKEPFFSFLGDSILNGGRLVLIVTANVITFVALAALIDKILGAIWSPLSLESILGVFMFIPSLLLGLDPATAWDMSQIMGLKLVTNEFVAMGQVTDTITTFSPHHQAVLTVFLTSFANFGTLGMIIGTFKGIVDKERNELIAKNVGRMLLSGILVSLLSAGMVGLFVW